MVEALGCACPNLNKDSHGTGLADALIAATAEEINAQIVTFNSKHFPMFNGIIEPHRIN